MRKSTLKFAALVFFMAMGSLLMAQSQFTVTFMVDMNNADPFDPATDEVYISGSFAGWAQPGTDTNYRMTPTEADPMVYSINVTVDSGMVQYKFFRVINGEASWDNGEWNGDPNRTTLALFSGMVFSHVWANMPYWVTFNVDMTNADPFDPATDKVYITGSFANWVMPGTIPELMMQPVEEGSMNYATMLLLYPGDYEYKYFRVINDVPSWDNGEWDGGDNRTFSVDTTMMINDVWGDINAGIFDTKAEFTYTMYPNPVNSTLYVKGLDNANRLEIYDVSGKLIQSVNLDAENINVNTSDLQSGVYIISVYSEKGVATSKFIKN